MSEEEVVRLVRTLIGDVNPIAESRYDEIVKDNINKRYEVISHLIADIGCMVTNTDGCIFGSIIECRSNGVRILESLKSEIEEYLYEAGTEE